MNISSHSGSNPGILRNQFQQFKKGQFNVQKTDLTDLKNTLGTTNLKATSGLDALLSSFDKIDRNKDGISFQELADFNKADEPVYSEKSSSIKDNRDECGKTNDADPIESEEGQNVGDRKKDPLPPVSKDDLFAYKALLEKDGKAVPRELTDFISGFDAIDSDKDGKVNFSEFKVYLSQIKSQQPDSARASPLEISKDDLSAMKDRLSQAILGINTLMDGFATVDSNSNGKINPDEFQAFLKSTSQAQAVNSGDSAKTIANGLDIFAMLNQNFQNSLNDSSQTKPSNLFLQKLVSRYEQKLQMTNAETPPVST